MLSPHDHAKSTMDAITYLFSLASRNSTAVAASLSSSSPSSSASSAVSAACTGASWEKILKTGAAGAGKGIAAASAWGMMQQAVTTAMVVLLWVCRWVVLVAVWMTPPQESVMGLVSNISRLVVTEGPTLRGEG